MSRKSKDVFSEVIVGLFMVAVLALLAYFTIVISGVDLLMGRARTSATIVFSDVGGLKERDSVVYRGMKVGAIEKITLGASNIVVSVKIDRDVVLREGYKASVAALSLLGGNYLLLEEGSGAPVPLEGTMFNGEPPVDWMRDLGAIARNLNDITSDGGLRSIITNIDETAKNLNNVMARVARGEGTVGKLLSPDNTLYGDLTNAVAGAKTTFGNAAAISERLEKGEGTLGKLLSSDDAVYADLKSTMASAAVIASRLEKGEGTLGRLLSPNEPLWYDLTNAVANIRVSTEKLKEGDGLLGRAIADKELADNASSLVENLKKVSDRLAQGEGTIGKLTTDSEMYDELNALIKDVRQIVDNYRDTTPISTFGSLIMGGL